MNLIQLRAFDAVARDGSFTRAAERLSVSQPAVTAHVKALENYYGVTLFQRRGRGIEPTELGRQLATISRRLFAAADEAADLLEATRELHEGRLEIAADGPHLLMPLLAAFRARYPGVSLALTMGNARDTLAHLLAERCDLAVLAELAADPALHAVAFQRHPIVAIVARGHPWALAGRASLAFAELDGVPMVMREPQSVTRRSVEAVCRERGVRPLRMLEIASREAMKEAVAAGLGIGVISAAELGRDERFHALGFADADIHHTQYLACLERRREMRPVRAFFSLLPALAAD